MDIFVDKANLSSVAGMRTSANCNRAKAFQCAAQMGGRGPVGPPIDDSIRIFYWGEIETIAGIAVKMADLHDSLFACSGWLSPKLMFNLLCAGGTAGLYQETISHSVNTARSKFQFFEGENEDASPADENLVNW